SPSTQWSHPDRTLPAPGPGPFSDLPLQHTLPWNGQGLEQRCQVSIDQKDLRDDGQQYVLVGRQRMSLSLSPSRDERGVSRGWVVPQYISAAGSRWRRNWQDDS